MFELAVGQVDRRPVTGDAIRPAVPDRVNGPGLVQVPVSGNFHPYVRINTPFHRRSRRVKKRPESLPRRHGAPGGDRGRGGMIVRPRFPKRRQAPPRCSSRVPSAGTRSGGSRRRFSSQSPSFNGVDVIHDALEGHFRFGGRSGDHGRGWFGPVLGGLFRLLAGRLGRGSAGLPRRSARPGSPSPRRSARGSPSRRSASGVSVSSPFFASSRRPWLRNPRPSCHAPRATGGRRCDPWVLVRRDGRGDVLGRQDVGGLFLRSQRHHFRDGPELLEGQGLNFGSESGPLDDLSSTSRGSTHAAITFAT